ncbi:type I-E CRISPR-associated protein Cse1/CasA [Streptomyces sp. MNU77]|uniref:type I-E CRISPR-associated protein Cse1/CasA n=1 Tax=Streptomyces sp. MNU77 TaxID=1573406 RepID=UPI0009A0F9E9|nr:type I-E CRISPR-associated protein Cse1/CasA [Streptomyces sp. MNU77]
MQTSRPTTTYRGLGDASNPVWRWDPRTQACQPALTVDEVSGRAVVRLMSLVDLLRNADRVLALSGSTAGEDVAVFEYLMAILYSSDHVPTSPEEWRRWVEGQESLSPAADWLAGEPDDRWDLFHPERPLGQNAELAPFLDGHGVGHAQVVIERAGDYNQFFDKSHLYDPEPMRPDVALRAMLAQHAYGLGGRAMAKADWLGPQLTYQAVGRLGTRIRVIAMGPTLGDTLRLNLVPGRDRQPTFNYSWTDGRRRRRTFRSGKEPRLPDGLADLYSFLGRSILLRPVLVDGRLMVDRVLMAAGELLAPLPPAYLQDAVLTRSGNYEGPLRPSADRAVWQEAHALYAAAADRFKGADLYDRLADLPDRTVNLWAVGLVARKSAAVKWVSDSFPYTSGLQVDLKWAADEGSAMCEYAAKALWSAAATAREAAYPNAKPADRKPQTARFNGSREMWAGAAAPFHALLDSVNANQRPDAGPLEAFGREIRTTMRNALRSRLASLPPGERGMRTRFQAESRLKQMLNAEKCPAYLKGSPDD